MDPDVVSAIGAVEEPSEASSTPAVRNRPPRSKRGRLHKIAHAGVPRSDVGSADAIETSDRRILPINDRILSPRISSGEPDSVNISIELIDTAADAYRPELDLRRATYRSSPFVDADDTRTSVSTGSSPAFFEYQSPPERMSSPLSSCEALDSALSDIPQTSMSAECEPLSLRPQQNDSPDLEMDTSVFPRSPTTGASSGTSAGSEKARLRTSDAPDLSGISTKSPQIRRADLASWGRGIYDDTRCPIHVDPLDIIDLTQGSDNDDTGNDSDLDELTSVVDDNGQDGPIDEIVSLVETRITETAPTPTRVGDLDMLNMVDHGSDMKVELQSNGDTNGHVVGEQIEPSCAELPVKRQIFWTSYGLPLCVYVIASRNSQIKYHRLIEVSLVF